MKLMEFLQGLKNCPNISLRSEFGICDNWYILLSCSPENIIKDFATKYTWSIPSGDSNFEFASERIKMKVLPNGKEDLLFTGIEMHDRFQSNPNNFKTLCSLHYLYDGRERSSEEYIDNMAIVSSLKKIIFYSFKNNLNLCFPKSIGTRYRNSENPARRIVYFPDSIEEVMNR